MFSRRLDEINGGNLNYYFGMPAKVEEIVKGNNVTLRQTINIKNCNGCILTFLQAG